MKIQAAVLTVITLALTLNPLLGRADITSPEVNLDQHHPLWRQAMQRGLEPDSLDRGTLPASGERVQPGEPAVQEFLREYSNRYLELEVSRPGGRPKRQAKSDQTAALEADLRHDLLRIKARSGAPVLNPTR